MAKEARAQQADVLLLGLRDPASPLSLVDTAVVKLIMEMRSAPIHLTTVYGVTEVRDPDTFELHSFGGQPAVMRMNGDMKWYRDGKKHRDGDMPAVERGDGTKIWYSEGRRHRNGDQPAIVFPNGDKVWYWYGNWSSADSSGGEPLIHRHCHGGFGKSKGNKCMDCHKSKAAWRCKCSCLEPTLCGRCAQKRRHTPSPSNGVCPKCNYPIGIDFQHI